MDSRYRDGLLAGVALAGLVALGGAVAGPTLFLEPVPLAAGVGGALAFEAIFLRYPDATNALWERPGVAVGSLLLVLGLGVAAIRTGSTWVVAALVWGLVAYVVLLGCVLAGLGNPLAFVRRGRRRQ